MDEREGEVKLVSHGGCSFGAPSVRRHDHTVVALAVDLCARLGRMHEVLADPFHAVGLGVEIVHGDIEEALDLRGMQIHRDDVVAARRLEHVCHEFCCDGGARLVLLVLSGVGEVGEDGGYAAGGGGFAGVADDKEFHQAVVDVVGASRLEDEDCDETMVRRASLYMGRRGIYHLHLELIHQW